jgi:hypothetical protein
MALLAAGAVGAAVHHPAANPGRTRVSTGSSTTTSRPVSTTPSTSTTTVAGPPPPGSAALEAGLISPTDMGGYYHVAPAAAVALLDSAPCLAALQASPAQAGRAVEALLGPDSYSVPTVIEDVASYPAAAAGSVYRSVVASVAACPSLAMDFGGRAVSAQLQAASIAPVGDADRVWSGTFDYGGAPFSLQLGVILDGPDVLTVLWIDTVPQSDPVMGNFASTVSLAIGKLA